MRTRDGWLALTGLLWSLAAGALHAQDELRVTFMHTSDEHSAVLPFPLVNHGDPAAATRGGFARLATAVATLRARAAESGVPVLLTSAGDNIAGTPFAWLTLEGAGTELELLVELGYDIVTLGNHEFDYDSERLARYLAAAGYPGAASRTALVASNTVIPAGHPLGALGIHRTVMRELPNGLRIGFFGLLGRGAARFATLAEPVTFADPHATAAAAVAELRAAGADIIVALTHSGLAEDRELARAVSGIDIILGGHDHRLLEEPLVEHGTIIVHPGAHTQHVFVLEVGWDRATRTARVRNTQVGSPFVIALDASVPESPWLNERIAAARARLDRLVAELTDGRVRSVDATIARAGFTLHAGPPMEETPLGNFVTDAMRHAVTTATGERVDFAFQANGVIRGDLVPGSGARHGDIAFYDLASVIGMGTGPDGTAGYPLVAVWLTGEEVRRVLEISVLLSELLRNSYYLQVSGLRMRYDADRAILLRLPFRGTPIPTGRAVLAAHRTTGGSGAVPLERGDERLYHVVTDYYVASFLPLVGRMLPRLALVPKDRNGAPLAGIDAAVVQRGGRELKVWQAVLEYAAAAHAEPRSAARAQPMAGGATAPHDAPTIPERYRTVEGRLVQASTLPLWLAPAAGLALLLVLIAVVVRRRRYRSPPTSA